MASVHELKAKQKSVRSIHKITNAMELVSTAKSRKAVKELSDFREYYSKVKEIVQTLSASSDYKIKDNYNNTLWVVFTSDLGLAGAYNNNIIKKFSEQFKDGDEIIMLGNKGLTAMVARYPNLDVKGFPIDAINNDSIIEEIVTEIQVAHFEKERRVNVIYTKYISQITFEDRIVQLLPIQKPEEIKETIQIDFEPSVEVVMSEMMDIYIPTIIIGYYKEASASEQSSRRIAMENATRNGEDLLEKLDIEFNKQRQAKITQELSEISAGSEALKEK